MGVRQSYACVESQTFCGSCTRVPEDLSCGPKRTQSSVVVVVVDEFMKFNYLLASLKCWHIYHIVKFSLMEKVGKNEVFFSFGGLFKSM